MKQGGTDHMGYDDRDMGPTEAQYENWSIHNDHADGLAADLDEGTDDFAALDAAAEQGEDGTAVTVAEFEASGANTDPEAAEQDSADEFWQLQQDQAEREATAYMARNAAPTWRDHLADTWAKAAPTPPPTPPTTGGPWGFVEGREKGRLYLFGGRWYGVSHDERWRVSVAAEEVARTRENMDKAGARSDAALDVSGWQWDAELWAARNPGKPDALHVWEVGTPEPIGTATHGHYCRCFRCAPDRRRYLGRLNVSDWSTLPSSELRTLRAVAKAAARYVADLANMNFRGRQAAFDRLAAAVADYRAGEDE